MIRRSSIVAPGAVVAVDFCGPDAAVFTTTFFCNFVAACRDHSYPRLFGPMSLDHITTLDNFIDHACDPSLGDDEDGNAIALQAIAPGDELRLDYYGGFVAHDDEPFVCQCGAACCRTRVTRQD